MQFEGKPTTVLGPYAEAQLAAILGYMQQSVSPGPYLLGDFFSAADILNAYILEMGAPKDALNAYPQLAKYLARITARPAAKKADELEKKHDHAPRSYFT